MTSPNIGFDHQAIADAVADLRAIDFDDDGLGAAVAAAAAAPTSARRKSPALERVLAEVQRQDRTVANIGAGVGKAADALERWAAGLINIDDDAAGSVQAQGAGTPLAQPTAKPPKHTPAAGGGTGGGGSW